MKVSAVPGQRDESKSVVSIWALCPRIGDGRAVKCQCVVTAGTKIRNN